jgi:hypothetical protein
MGMRPLRDQVKDIVHQRNNDVQPREHFLATQWPPAQNTRLETQPSACVIYRSPANQQRCGHAGNRRTRH